MNPMVFDVETSGAIRNKGNPFDPRNKLMCIGVYGRFAQKSVCPIEHRPEPYKQWLDWVQNQINQHTLLVGANLKFDIHWGKRYGLKFSHMKVWDILLYHFFKTNQTVVMPSLNVVLEHYGLPLKLDVVKTEFWDKGLDTDQVPWETLETYSYADLEAEWTVFWKQWEEFQALPANRQRLILEHMQDLLTLEEMEYNGFPYDGERSMAMGRDIERTIATIDSSLSRYVAGPPISFNSDRQLSAFLYGGDLVLDEQETFIFTYKDGRTKEKQRWIKKIYTYPKIVEPLKGSDNSNGWSVGVDVLKALRLRTKGFQTSVLDALIKRSKLEKRKSTYCFGTPKLMESMQWENQTLHPNINQTVAITGRLSCSKPNLQNQDGEMRVCFPTQYKM